jgi:WD40 repeat protein
MIVCENDGHHATKSIHYSSRRREISANASQFCIEATENYEGSNAPIVCLASHENRVMSGNTNGIVQVWQTTQNSSEPAFTLKAPVSIAITTSASSSGKQSLFCPYLSDVRFGSSKEVVVSASFDHNLYLWDLTSPIKKLFCMLNFYRSYRVGQLCTVCYDAARYAHDWFA